MLHSPPTTLPPPPAVSLQHVSPPPPPSSPLSSLNQPDRLSFRASQSITGECQVATYLPPSPSPLSTWSGLSPPPLPFCFSSPLSPPLLFLAPFIHPSFTGRAPLKGTAARSRVLWSEMHENDSQLPLYDRAAPTSSCSSCSSCSSSSSVNVTSAFWGISVVFIHQEDWLICLRVRAQHTQKEVMPEEIRGARPTSRPQTSGGFFFFFCSRTVPETGPR
uniref:Uncharacterized protein n=1 Tax=Knipowitschia caucasica TaxID=637954 RepID=A0AAV2KK47_KNICA